MKTLRAIWHWWRGGFFHTLADIIAGTIDPEKYWGNQKSGSYMSGNPDDFEMKITIDVALGDGKRLQFGHEILNDDDVQSIMEAIDQALDK